MYAGSPYKQTQRGREHGQKSNPQNRQEIQNQETQNQENARNSSVTLNKTSQIMNEKLYGMS